MAMKPVFIGTSETHFNTQKINGEFINLNNETFYKITNSDKLRPFFISVISYANHWMFISSNGAISAGRKNSDTSLFPYYTVDKITESAENTGSKTIFQIHKDNRIYLWEPFSDKYEGIYSIKRNLYKNTLGNKILFEEINNDLGVTYRYQWSTSNNFGFVKTSTVVNNTDKDIHCVVLDGIQNIMPYGVSEYLQNSTSNLVDAYKKNELYADSGLAVFALSAIIVDKPEPSEALKATAVWSIGINKPTYLLSTLQLDTFRKGKKIKQERTIKAEKGAYFVKNDFILKGRLNEKWQIVANVNQSITSITSINDKIKNEKNLAKIIQSDIDDGSVNLKALNAASDGLQITADKLKDARQFSNTLFNIMRGGIFDTNYQIEKDDFINYVKNSNSKIYSFYQGLLNALPQTFSVNWLRNSISRVSDDDLERICIEYMPLKFSRRHGDPSRPWNKFSINTQSEIDGSKILDYEGNWRDIFQNWEALAHAYPVFIEGMIFKSLNATTFEGYNPYRVIKNGFDWEVSDENDPWSYIGYWGDHQIIYLLKFLEFIENFYPNKLSKYFEKNLFVYANVPYKIKTYEAIKENPKDTIEFDIELHEDIQQRTNELGSDAFLLRDSKEEIYKVNLIEKLLATILSKVSNFIPEAGIWLNTQRPEWNDANNALVGNGTSMVTLYYLRRFLVFFDNQLSKTSQETVKISKELRLLFTAIHTTLHENLSLLKEKISDEDRNTIIDALGNASSKYRTSIYEQGFSNKKESIALEDIKLFTTNTLLFLDHSIKANKRADSLYHAYNLITVDSDTEISVSYLSEMLEGQVAILSSTYLSAYESVKVLDSLRKSALYRADQNSYILYPNKELASFDKKNTIPKKYLKKSALLKKLVESQNTQIVEKDCLGRVHFNASFNNAKNLSQALQTLPVEIYGELVEKEKDLLLDIFEEVFDHKSFTGRSGTFFGYEGLGSIYWHMVSKFLLAVQETYQRAYDNKESDEILKKLSDHYHEIYEGIGVHKSPKKYGAFPTDPYSHTPAGKGVKQPGMTGQVKEDLLSRLGEFGVLVKDGILSFNPSLLKKNVFLQENSQFNYFDVQNNDIEIEVEKNSLCFTYCQVPIIYKLSNKSDITVFFTDDTTTLFNQKKLDMLTSKLLFERTGNIEKIVVSIPQNKLV